MLIPTRIAGLQAVQFLFFKPLVNHSKISFPFSNVSSLLLSLLLLLSLSRCKSIRDAKNLPSPLFKSSPQQSIPTQNFQNLPHTFSKMPFILAYPSPPLSICTTSCFFPFNLRIPPPPASEL